MHKRNLTQLFGLLSDLGLEAMHYTGCAKEQTTMDAALGDLRQLELVTQNLTCLTDLIHGLCEQGPTTKQGGLL